MLVYKIAADKHSGPCAYFTCYATRRRPCRWDQHCRLSNRRHQLDVPPTTQDIQHRSQYHCQCTVSHFPWSDRQAELIRRSTLTLRWHWGFSPVPLRCAFWSANTCISRHCQVIIRQANLDHSLSSLLSKIQNVYEFLLEEDTKANLDMMKDTLARIAEVVSSYAQFIENYSQTKNFCMLRRILP